MPNRKFIRRLLASLLLISSTALISAAQNEPLFSLTEENLQPAQTIELDKLKWRYHPGDETGWAAKEFDDAAWEQIEGTKIDPKNLPASGWNGRGWFRLRFNADEKLAGKNLALISVQTGASEVYLDGNLLARFGEIKAAATGEIEYNPNRLPIPFRLDQAGEHVLAVRFSASNFADMSRGVARWLTTAGAYPGINLSVKNASDLTSLIAGYAGNTSMRGGFLFAGFLFALALLHFLLYIFYRVERANLYYSFFAAAFGVNILCGNYRSYGHLETWENLLVSLTTLVILGLLFTLLPAFLLVAFRRPITRIFWGLTALWVVSLTLYMIFLNQYLVIRMLPSVLIGVSFTYCIVLLVSALRKKRRGAWILFGGVFALQFGMLMMLLRQLNVLVLPQDLYLLAELCIVLGVPIAVSIFLARNFARTNRDLQAKLIEVELLSEQKIEHERHAAELRAENERRAKELEEARQLQLSMLPKNVPQLPDLEIAAYMKPATEVGGDYYDFHLSEDGTLTVAVGDATGHGLKAGTVVTATKGLFNNLAPEPHIPSIFKQTSSALKLMNLRGLFMAMAMLKVKDNQFSLSVAGMPAVLIYRNAAKSIEEIAIKAMPLGSIVNFPYEERRFSLSTGDCVVAMSDGFPEMFNEAGEMLGFEKSAEILPEIAELSAQGIIDHFVKIGEKWAGSRPPDDDVTFMVLKVT